jgi:hypothetical protein
MMVVKLQTVVFWIVTHCVPLQSRGIAKSQKTKLSV